MYDNILTVRDYICLLLAEFSSYIVGRERMMCGSAVSVLLFLLWSLVEVHSQTAPYLTFMGETLPDHSYVDLSLVGGAGSGNEVICHTDLSTCCRGGGGPDRGDWYFPNGDRLPFRSRHPLVERRLQQRVELYRGDGSGSAPSGIYRCSIETNAVHSADNTDNTTRETVYVGLYESGGDHAIINPRRACPARVTVVVLSVCLSVCAHSIRYQQLQCYKRKKKMWRFC